MTTGGLYDRYLAINRYELRLGIAMRKEILRRRGAIPTAVCRPPVAPLDRTTLAELDTVLDRLVRDTEPLEQIRTSV